jgi:hypothetical protein
MTENETGHLQVGAQTYRGLWTKETKLAAYRWGHKRPEGFKPTLSSI